MFDNFKDTWSLLEWDIHRNAINHGFWDGDRNNGEALALIHSEVSEALEALRHGNPASTKADGFTAVEEELADAVIRIMDLAAGRNWNVAAAIVAKHLHNRGRPHKHGKEF